MLFPFFDETEELNELTRAGMSGSFAALTDGVTHYEVCGDKKGIPVVLVHGFSVPNFIFDSTFEYLCNSGFRVLRYDLFGRGLSDRPQSDYDIHLFTLQLKDLIDHLDFNNINLLGLSMGGPITASFINQFPEYVASHILIDPAGAKAVRFLPLLKVATLPILGELLLGLFGSGSMVKNIASDLFTPELVKPFQERYKIQMKYKGFKRAILSTVRNNMLDSFIDSYRKTGSLNKPTLLFWGRQDATVPFEHSREILKAIPHAQFEVIGNCGHLPHYERPEEVHPILLEFLSRKQK